jgi:hypothetical protein
MSVQQPVGSPAPLPTPQGIAPYHPPPSYPPPGYGQRRVTPGQAVTSLALAIIGILLGLPLGVPGLVLGPIAYFLGKAAVSRIEASGGALGGHSMAVTGWVLGIVATAVGALVSLIWLVLLLVTISSSSEPATL